PVVVEVPGGNGRWPVANRHRISRGECATRAPKENAHVVVHAVHDGKIEVPITIEVARCNRDRGCPGWVRDGGCKCPVAIIQQHRDLVGPVIHHSEIGFPIFVEITGEDGKRGGPRWVVSFGRKRSVAIPQEYGDSVALIVRDCKTQLLVSSEIAHRNRNWLGVGPGYVIDTSREGPVSLVQENRDRAFVGISDGKVRDAVTVIIGDGDGDRTFTRPIFNVSLE